MAFYARTGEKPLRDEFLIRPIQLKDERLGDRSGETSQLDTQSRVDGERCADGVPGFDCDRR